MSNIKNLSREEKLKLIQVLEEKKRRKKYFRTAYTPNEGQLAVHKSDKRIRAVFSGNGAGKSCCAINEIIWACLGYNPVLKKQTPVPCKAVLLLDDFEKIQEQFVPEINKWFDTTDWSFEKRGHPYVSAIVFPNGSTLRFLGTGSEPSRLEGIEVDFVVCDEPPPRSHWIALSRGGRRKHREPKFLFVGTPIGGGAAWMRSELYEPWANGERPDIECFRYGTVVNQQNLADNYIENFSANLSEKEKRIRLEGEFFDISGLALGYLFNDKVHILPADYPVNCESYVVAIDPHPQKPHYVALLGVDSEGFLYYIKEASQKMLPRDFAKFLKEWTKGFNVIDIVCDSLGNSPYSGGDSFKSFITVLNEEGVRARSTTFADKDDKLWLDRIRQVLAIPKELDNFGNQIPKLRILQGNDGIIKDVKTVIWKKRRHEDYYEDKLDISQKDYLSCLKYALASNITPGKAKAKIYKRIEMPSSYGLKKKGTKFNFRRPN